MALARLRLKNPVLLLHRSPLLFSTATARATAATGTPRLLSSSAAPAASSSSSEQSGDGRGEVAVSKSSSASPSRRRGRRGRGLWRDPWDLVPFRRNNNGLGSLGNALVQVSDNVSRLLESWAPSRLFGRMKEDDKLYKLKFEVPGLRKEDLRITVEDGFLVITGEHKDEEAAASEDDNDGWYSYGYYNTSLLLPDDARVEEIKAEVKDGMLYVTIPRSGEHKKNVKEVQIH